MIVCPAFATLHCGCLLFKYSQTESPRCLAQYGRHYYTTFADASCTRSTTPRMFSSSRGTSILPQIFFLSHQVRHTRNEASVQLCQPPFPKSRVRGTVSPQRVAVGAIPLKMLSAIFRSAWVYKPNRFHLVFFRILSHKHSNLVVILWLNQATIFPAQPLVVFRHSRICGLCNSDFQRRKAVSTRSFPIGSFNRH